MMDDRPSGTPSGPGLLPKVAQQVAMLPSLRPSRRSKLEHAAANYDRGHGRLKRKARERVLASLREPGSGDRSEAAIEDIRELMRHRFFVPDNAPTASSTYERRTATKKAKEPWQLERSISAHS